MSQRSSVTELARPRQVAALSPRDLHLLRLLADGRSTGQIAAALSVSSNTARTKIRRLQAKLAVSDRSAAVRVAGTLASPVPLQRGPEDRLDGGASAH